MSKVMSHKRQMFVEYYLQTLSNTFFNATEAARLAGYRHPQVLGPRMTKEPKVAALIAERMNEIAMKSGEVLARFTEQAKVSIADFIEEKEEYIGVDKTTGELISAKVVALNWETIKARGHLVKSISMTANGPKIELHDGQVALIQLGRYHKLFTENLDILSGGKKIVVTLKTDDSK